MSPTIGRIVHYKHDDGDIRPAIITHVWDKSCVNLQVFLDGTLDSPPPLRTTLVFTSVSRGRERRQWDWPVIETK